MIDEPGPIREGEALDVPRLEEHLLEHLTGSRGPLTVEQFPSGFSNLTYALKLGETQLVLRRPPFGNQARISRDGGASWSGPLTISADGAGGDLGYPSTVQLADGSLVTVWYEKLKESPHAVLRQARWSIEE